MKIKIIKILLWCTTVATLICIFYFSAQNAVTSTTTSNVIVSPVIEYIEKETGYVSLPEYYRISELIRDSMHFLEFMFLGINTTLLSYVYRIRHYLVSPFSISLICAAIDETHQLFVDGRGASLVDVMIDSFGALCGVLLICFMLRLFDKYRTR